SRPADCGCGSARAGLLARARGGSTRRFGERGSQMKKFLVLYKASAAAFAEVMKAPPDQQKKGMDEWMKWSQKAASSIVDMGGPLGKAMVVTPKGATPTSNDLGGYSVLQA